MPPKKDSFNVPMIHRPRQRRGLGNTQLIWSGNVPRQHDGEVTLQEKYADRVGAHCQTVYGWLGCGRSKVRLAKVDSQRIWLVNAANTQQESKLESHDEHTIEQVFAKLKLLLRKAAERSVDATWQYIGSFLDAFTTT
jgi:hypothetical protein